MLNVKLLLALFLCFCTIVNCSIDGPHYLCSDHFSEESGGKKKVFNSYYRLEYEKQLEPLSTYFPDPEANERLISLIYSDLDWNKTQLCQELTRPVEYFRPRISSRVHLRERLLYEEHMLSHFPPGFGNELKEILLSLCKDTLSVKLLSKDELNATLLELYELVKDQKDLNSLFEDKIIDILYKKPIVSLDNIKIERQQNIYLDNSTVATIEYSVYIPFNDRNISSSVKENCTQIDSSNNLPSIFKISKIEAEKNSELPDSSREVPGLLVFNGRRLNNWNDYE